ncbi:TPR domain protein, putative component of TonB system [Fimbriiglobus ruber]|uniref:TPR domain protein, putative component of TonB system n=1 Tax=Fimbriiglobus ruber TaxID=1908690 RepID=A0A225DSP6_9BACT|nr:TPR domain protein, putative component of TonB system [Fimbriiglobus ruber]
MYRQFLSEQPEHPDALHLLGVVALQQGENGRAVEYIGRAIARNPDNAAYHVNLAEAYRGLGQLDRAAECCRTALSIRPQSAEAANNLGMVLLAQGRTAEAADQFREALRLKPDFGMACNNVGNALRLLGDFDGAVTHFRRATRIDPDLAEAHSNLGQLLLERHQPHEALAHLRNAVRLRPGLAEARNNLGNALREMGRVGEARQSYAEALRVNPNLAMTYNNMGQALQEENALDDALAWYQRALQLAPGSARTQTNLASLLAEQERYDEAVTVYRRALELDPTYAKAHSGLGSVRHEQGHFEQAQAHYREALGHEPDLPATLCALGTVYEELGDFKGAENFWRTALGHDPNLAGAYSALATMLRGKLPDDDLAAMRRLLADPDLHDGRRSALHFGLAQILDAHGAYGEAGESLRQANVLALAGREKRGQSYDPTEHARFVSGMMTACSPAFFERVRGIGLDSERPIFIVGLPRSGTTLTEQILASHSRVFGAGELRFARDDFETLAAGDDRRLDALSRLDQLTASRVGEQHLVRLRGLNVDRPHVADKMPDNYLYLGLLAALFPKAKFIHCRRDLRDIAASCWMTNFRHIRWANDVDHIASRFEEYHRIMNHWRRVLPVRVLEVEYEETVADLERMARLLVGWCGLDWEPACLAFHEGKRPVRTASVSQVRQPIYKRSVARWKHYESVLGALFDRLVQNCTVAA